MAVTITHPFVSPVADAGDPDEVGPNEWNAAHTVTGLGTAAEANTTDFATAAQGAKADSALQSVVAGSGISVNVTDPQNPIITATGSGTGDMLAATYDPQAIAGDAFARANHTGTQSADTLTDGTTNKAYTATEKTKLAGIATGATANSSDATLLARANHTGTQAASTISDFSAAADARVAAAVGVSVQAYDADLTTWAGLTPSANAQSLVTAADYAGMRALLDLEAGTDFLSPAAIAAAYQPIDADLTSWAGVTRAAGFDAFVATPSSANLRSLLTDETGTGPAVFATSPALTTPSINSGAVLWDAGTRELIGLSVAITNGGAQYLTKENAGRPGQVGGNEGLFQFSADASCSFIGFFKTRATTKGLFNVAVQAQDDLGEVNFAGSDGTNFVKAGFFTAVADGAVSSGIVPMRYSWGNMDPAGALPENMRLDSSGNLIIGGLTPGAGYSATDKLEVAGSIKATNARRTAANLGVWHVLAQSAVAVPVTGTTAETVMATIPIPAGAMGPNGAIRVTTVYSVGANNANNKFADVRFGGTGGTLYWAANLANSLSQRNQLVIQNRNSQSSQVGGVAFGALGTPQATGVTTSAVDTSAAVDLVISGANANAGDTITLESYIVEVLYGA